MTITDENRMNVIGINYFSPLRFKIFLKIWYCTITNCTSHNSDFLWTLIHIVLIFFWKMFLILNLVPVLLTYFFIPLFNLLTTTSHQKQKACNCLQCGIMFGGKYWCASGHRGVGFRKARSVDRSSIRRVAALTKGSSISCTSGRSLPTSSLDVLGQEGWCTAEKQWSLILNGWREETLENRGADLALWSPPSMGELGFLPFLFHTMFLELCVRCIVGAAVFSLRMRL